MTVFRSMITPPAPAPRLFPVPEDDIALEPVGMFTPLDIPGDALKPWRSVALSFSFAAPAFAELVAFAVMPRRRTPA